MTSDRVVPTETLTLEEVAKSMASKIESLDARLESLHRCLTKLAPQQRRMIPRRYDIGGSVRAIAADLGRPVASVRVGLHRIRRSLIECIAPTLEVGRGA